MGDLSAHFSRHEFACYCGCGLDTVDIKQLENLEAIRQHFGATVTITPKGGCRCKTANKDAGGAKKSQHPRCRASDIVVEGVTPDEVADYAETLGVGGLGRYNTFTHIDSRTDGPARWSGR